MEEIKNFENYVDEILQNLETKTKVFKELKLLLNSNVIKEDCTHPSIKSDTRRSYIKRTAEAPSVYPKHGPARNKVRYIMSHYSKAIQYSDMEDLIFKLEGNKGKKWFDVFQRALRGLTHPKNGELIYYNYKNSKHRFYIKHEWLNEEKNDVLAEFAPNFDAIKDIPIEEIIPNNIEFHKSK